MQHEANPSVTITQAVILHPHIPQKRTAGNTPLYASVDASRPLSHILAEATRLAESIGLRVATADILHIEKPHPATLLGRGMVESLAHKLNGDGMNDENGGEYLVIINASLTPVQHRNLEQALTHKVIDRTALILEIFGARAKSRSGRLQVELAALSFQRSRLVRSWTHLERQRGGGGFMGGPGERQIELDRRMLSTRIKRIKTQLKQVERTRHIQRHHRQQLEVPTIALIGYTNAGKSSLFNAFTNAGAMAADMLFATLDPSMRGVRLSPANKANGSSEGQGNKIGKGRAVILADTVGFISQLPTELIAAFKSTLEEVVLADVLLHVHDCASPVAQEEAEDVTQVLYQLGMTEEEVRAKVIHVFNKCDLLDTQTQAQTPAQAKTEITAKLGEGVFVSATTGEGLDTLAATLDSHFARVEHRLTIALPFTSGTSGKARAWLYQHGAVLAVAQDDHASHEHISVVLSPANLARFTRLYPDAAWHEQETDPANHPLINTAEDGRN